MKKLVFISGMSLFLIGCDKTPAQVTVVDYTKLVENSKVLTAAYNQDIKAKQVEFTAQLEIKQKAAQEFRENCDKQNPVTDPSCNLRTTPVDQEFLQYQNMASNQMKIAGEKFNSEFNPYIVKAIAEVGEHTVVLNSAGVVFAPDASNITKAVGKHIDENYKK